jgi:hypothetical protein
VILLYNKFSYLSGENVTSWASLTLGVTFACGYVFVATALAGALLPFRARALYEASPGSAYRIGGYPLVTVVGIVGFVAGVLFELLFIFNDQLGLTTNLARVVVLAVLLVSAVWYVAVKYTRRSSGINVEYAFKEIPPE